MNPYTLPKSYRDTSFKTTTASAREATLHVRALEMLITNGIPGLLCETEPSKITLKHSISYATMKSCVRGIIYICMMVKIRFCSSRLAVYCVPMIIVYPILYMYFIATNSQRINIAATDIKPGHSYYNSSPTGYVLAVRYAGQQGAGVLALATLQRWVKNARLPMLIVEPFINNSVLKTCTEYSQRSIKFSDMFDLKNFNRVSRGEGVTELVPWETYVTSAPPDAILVMVKRFRGRGPVPPFAVLWAAQPGSGECWQSSGGHSDVWIKNKRLCYIRVVHISFKHFSSRAFSAKEAHTAVLAGLNPTTVTIVFEYWYAPSVKFESPLFSPSSYLSDGLNDVSNNSVFLVPKLQDSPKLLRDVEDYQKQFLKGSSGPSYVAVMLRAEHSLLMLNERNEGNGTYNMSAQLQNCLDEVVTKTSMMMAKLETKNVFVTADVGLYGSRSWQKTLSRARLSTRQLTRVEEQVKLTVKRLYSDQWTFEQWEKSFSVATGGVEDKGYTAAVQRGLASRGSCLILLGGGEFHTLALKHYVDRTEPHNRCIDLICIHENEAVGVLYKMRAG